MRRSTSGAFSVYRLGHNYKSEYFIYCIKSLNINYCDCCLFFLALWTTVVLLAIAIVLVGAIPFGK